MGKKMGLGMVALGFMMASASSFAATSEAGVFYFFCRYPGDGTAAQPKCDAQARLFAEDGDRVHLPNRMQIVCGGETIYDDFAKPVESKSRLRISAVGPDSDAKNAIVLPTGPIGSDLATLDSEIADPTLTTSWLELATGEEMRGYCEVRRGRAE